MYAIGNKKSLNMMILDILKRYSDEKHLLTQQKIIEIIKSEYGMECDRRSVKNNIISLTELGYEISMEERKGYYLITRDFEDAELRMLIDAVLFSNNISNRQARELIKKLTRQASENFEAKVSHISNLPGLHKSDNKQMMYVLDALNDAISEKKKVSFTYNDYGTDMKMHPRRDEKYIVNPYQMVANNGRYYLIGNYDKYDNISHYRIDRITDLKILDEKRKKMQDVEGMENGLNLPKHMAEHIYMFSGESARIHMKAEKHLMNELVDWFGKDFRIIKDKDDMLEISLDCNENAMFFWALQYGPYVEVMRPEGLRNRIAESVKAMMEKYEDYRR